MTTMEMESSSGHCAHLHLSPSPFPLSFPHFPHFLISLLLCPTFPFPAQSLSPSCLFPPPISYSFRPSTHFCFGDRTTASLLHLLQSSEGRFPLSFFEFFLQNSAEFLRILLEFFVLNCCFFCGIVVFVNLPRNPTSS